MAAQLYSELSDLFPENAVCYFVSLYIDYGFRLPSAYDNRPLKAEEFWAIGPQKIYFSATPAEYETKKSQQVIEQIIRPTGLIDPEIRLRKQEGQIPDLKEEIKQRAERKKRTLVTTLTKKMAEDLADYLSKGGSGCLLPSL